MIEKDDEEFDQNIEEELRDIAKDIDFEEVDRQNADTSETENEEDKKEK